MGRIEVRKKTWIWLAALGAVLFLQVLVIVYFGSRKTGFHEDEYYSFYSTNRTAGLYEPDREWMDRESIRKEFVVLEGERFRYGLISTVQSWDVHPPFYYFILHTASSLVPGIFSKWIGIVVNLVAFILNFILLARLTFLGTGKNRVLTLLVSAVYGLDGIAISGVMFIRMYEWMTVFVLASACLHVRAMRSGDRGFIRFLLPLAAVSYLGFLTQYYYLIFLFFMATGFVIWQLYVDRKLINCVRYAVCCQAAGILAVISYPACLSHIFRGYRGTEAMAEFLDQSNTWDRLRFFAGLMNEYVFEGYLPLALCLMGGMGVFLLLWKKRTGEKIWAGGFADSSNGVQAHPQEKGGKEGKAAWLLLLFASCGYFFTVSQTALLLYETSNRYQLPIYGIVMMLVLTALYGLGKKLAVCLGWGHRARIAALCGLAAGFLLGDVRGLLSDKVLFLYEEDAQGLAFARENASVPAVVLYNDSTPYHVWWRSQELLEYDRVYFASQANREKITDQTIAGCERLIVYAADYDTQEESLAMILESNPGLRTYRLVGKEQLWSIYEFE